jgi:hypothetical protein
VVNCHTRAPSSTRLSAEASNTRAASTVNCPNTTAFRSSSTSTSHCIGTTTSATEAASASALPADNNASPHTLSASPATTPTISASRTTPTTYWCTAGQNQ